MSRARRFYLGTAECRHDRGDVDWWSFGIGFAYGAVVVGCIVFEVLR